MNPGRFLTTTQAAAYLSVSRPTLYKLIDGKEVAVYKILRNYRFTKEDLDEYLKRIRVPSKPIRKPRARRWKTKGRRKKGK